MLDRNHSSSSAAKKPAVPLFQRERGAAASHFYGMTHDSVKAQEGTTAGEDPWVTTTNETVGRSEASGEDAQDRPMGRAQKNSTKRSDHRLSGKLLVPDGNS